MDRPLEEKLVAVLDAVGAMLPRREIFSRVDDDFDTEEDLARALGRLVADGRLVKELRPRLNKPDEAVYGTPKAARVCAIAAAAKMTAAHQPAPPAHAPSHTEPAAPAHPAEQENDMGKRRSAEEILEAVKDAVLGARETQRVADIAKATGATPDTVKRSLKALIKEGVLASVGTGRATRYGPASAPVAAEASPRAERDVTKKHTRAALKALEEGSARFGYFSDGSLSIEAQACKGTLSRADLEALRTFVTRFDA